MALQFPEGEIDGQLAGGRAKSEAGTQAERMLGEVAGHTTLLQPGIIGKEVKTGVGPRQPAVFGSEYGKGGSPQRALVKTPQIAVAPKLKKLVPENSGAGSIAFRGRPVE